MFTNKHQDIVETNIRETQVSDHRLVELLLGYNPLSPKKDTASSHEKYSFTAADFHRADFDTMNEQFSSVNWQSLKELCYQTNGPPDYPTSLSPQKHGRF